MRIGSPSIGIVSKRNRIVPAATVVSMLAFQFASLLGPTAGLDPWVVGAAGLLPFGLLGWSCTRSKPHRLVAALAGATFVVTRIGLELADATPMGLVTQIAGVVMLAGIALLASKARRATDAHRLAMVELAEKADELEMTLRMQNVVAEAASALLKEAPVPAVETSIATIQRALGATGVYVARSEPDSGGPAAELEWFDGVASQSVPTSTRPWALMSYVGLGPNERLEFETPDGSHEVVLPITAGSTALGFLGIVLRPATEWGPREERMLTTVAELVAAAWERQRTSEKLQELLRAKDRFLASVSHELRTPLAVIVGFALELRDHLESFDGDEVAQLIALVAQQSEELRDMIEDLLVAARVEEAQLSVISEEVDLARSIPRIVGSLPAEALSKVTCCATRPPVVLADGLRLRQVLRNLIMNAHRHGGPNIRLTAKMGDGFGLIRVIDDGPGIPDEHHETIFQPYGRAVFDPGRTESIGLGLTVSRQLARLMGGDLTYRRDAAGSTFELCLPLAAEQPADVGALSVMDCVAS